MKKLLAISLISIFMLVGFNACKKYEDGPTLSLRSKKARVVGEWILSKATNQGTAVALANANEFVKTLSIKDNDSYSKINTAGTESGTWKFDGDKENVIFTVTGSPTAETLRIIRLTNDELTLERTVGSQVTVFYLVTN